MMLVYPPIDRAGAIPSSPTNENAMGIAEITPEPRPERTHSATPKVIKNMDMSSNTCCHAKPIALIMLIRKISAKLTNFTRICKYQECAVKCHIAMSYAAKTWHRVIVEYEIFIIFASA